MENLKNEGDIQPAAIHGHQVLQHMIDHGCYTSKLELIDELNDHFGQDKTYYTCANSNLSAEDIVKFLIFKGKIMFTEEGLKTDENKICKHH